MDLGKDGHILERALRVLAPGCNAIRGMCGAEVGRDMGYGRARYLAPAQVQEVASRLCAVAADSFPQPDPDGYWPDPRIETDPTVRRLAEELEIVGADTDRRDQMDELGLRFKALRDHYVRATDRGDGVLLFVR